MDTRTLFRNLVTGKYIRDYDYYSGLLSFQTVCYSSSSDYCACICSYEHEFIDYVSEDGSVDDDMYNRVLENILNGQCPHVASAPTEYVVETGIYGIHIAAVAGPLRAVKRYSHNYLYKRGKIFERDPCQIAIIKNRATHVDLFYKARVTGCSVCNSNSTWKKCLLSGMRSGDQVEFWHTPVLQFCARQGQSRITKSVLNSFTTHNPADIARLLESTFMSEQKETQLTILKYLEKRSKWVLEWCAKVAVLCDQPRIFAQILHLISQNKGEDATEDLTELFTLLQRDISPDYLTKGPHRRTYHLAETTKSFTPLMELRVELVVTLIDRFTSVISSQMLSCFKKVLQQDAIDGTPCCHHASLISVYIDSLRGGHNASSDDRVPYKDKMDLLIQIGGNIDHVDDSDTTPMKQVLSDREFEFVIRSRELLEVLIYENSSLEMNNEAVSLGISRESKQRDESVRIGKEHRLHYPGKLLLDARMHPYYGHDDSTNFALNFIGPLLIECGYPVDRGVLEAALGLESLHPSEREYYQNTLDNPRPLQFQCRDALRKHFKGRGIHNFVKYENIPKHIGDMILLRPILRNAHAIGNDSY